MLGKIEQKNADTAATAKPARAKKPLTKRQKVILSVCICVAVALIATGATLLAVFIPRKEAQNYKVGVGYKRYYSYAMDVNSKETALNGDFAGNVPFAEFAINTVESSEYLTLEEGFVVRNSCAPAGDSARFEVAYKDVVIADIRVVVKNVRGYIADAESLWSMSDGVYVLTSDIDVSGDARRIAAFYGELYGNGHKITGLDMSYGAMFGKLTGATVEGVELGGITGEIAVTDACSVGALVGEADKSTVSRCLAEGAFTVRSSASSPTSVFVGGILGRASATETDGRSSGYTYTGLVSAVKISVYGSGNVRVGGISGGMSNVGIRESRSYAELTVGVSSQEIKDLGALYVGGMVGASADEHKATVGVYDLKEDARLFCYAKIDVDITGGSGYNICYVGGIYGALVNRNVANSTFDGEVDVCVTRAGVNAGGIAGMAENDTGYRMTVRGVSNGGTEKVYSYGTVALGGLIGTGVGVEYEQCEVANEPTMETDTAKLQGKQTKSNAIGVSK